MTDHTTADLRDEIAEALMAWAERNANPQYATMRRPETVRQNAYGRADAVLAVLAARQAGGQQPDTTTPDPTTADDPVQLRWGLGDVLHGDDDSVIVCLSGPDREPYWLELDPERAAALRDDLGVHTCPDGEPCPGHDEPAPAAGPDDTQTTDAHPARAVWVIEWHRAAKNEWLPDQPPYKHRQDAVDEIARQQRHNPARQLRLVRETTTWTVEEDETR
ncbi:hypothetical protein ACWDXD_33415 [Streptomyces sp. NPDC003314]